MEGLVKLDRNSNVLWRTHARAHHDLEVLPNGTIYVLTKGGPGVATESISIFAYRFNFEYWKLGESSALAVVIFLMFFAVFGFLFIQLQKRYRIF